MVAASVAFGPNDAHGRPHWELRLGRWQDVLRDSIDDPDDIVVITDPPFAERVHQGRRTGSERKRRSIQYASLQPEEPVELAEFIAEEEARWSAVFTDHSLFPAWEAAYRGCGLYAFAPVLYVRSKPTPRQLGDGPTSACDYIAVARPRIRLRQGDTGSRPGYYLVPPFRPARERRYAGSKHVDVMAALVRDYSMADDLVVDPYAGSGTTLIAALREGRRALGAEADPNAFAMAVERLSRGWTPPLHPHRRHFRQEPLWE